MCNVSILYGLSRIYFFKKGIDKLIKIEMIQICMKYLMSYNKLFQNFTVSNNKYLLSCIIADI